MEIINKIIDKCRGAIEIEINPHRNIYMGAKEYIDDEIPNDIIRDLQTETYSKIVSTNTVIVISFYPRTPVASYVVVHYDIGLALEEVVQILNQQIKWE